MEITANEYEKALRKIENLLPMIDDNTPLDSPESLEFQKACDAVEAYEDLHYPVKPLTTGELIRLHLQERGFTLPDLSTKLGVSPSKLSDMLYDRSEPSLSQARTLCQVLGIEANAMLGI